MNNSNAASLHVAETTNASTVSHSSGISAKPRIMPVLVSSSEPGGTTRKLIDREEALRQAILRSG